MVLLRFTVRLTVFAATLWFLALRLTERGQLSEP